MGKLRTLHRHHSGLAPGELTAEEYSGLSKTRKKDYKRKALDNGFKPVWIELYTENDLRSMQIQRSKQ